MYTYPVFERTRQILFPKDLTLIQAHGDLKTVVPESSRGCVPWLLTPWPHHDGTWVPTCRHCQWTSFQTRWGQCLTLPLESLQQVCLEKSTYSPSQDLELRQDRKAAKVKGTWERNNIPPEIEFVFSAGLESRHFNPTDKTKIAYKAKACFPKIAKMQTLLNRGQNVSSLASHKATSQLSLAKEKSLSKISKTTNIFLLYL